MVEVQSEGSSPNIVPAGLENAFTEGGNQAKRTTPLKNLKAYPALNVAAKKSGVMVTGHRCLVILFSVGVAQSAFTSLVIQLTLKMPEKRVNKLKLLNR